jgi:hypothetical protein
VGVAAVCDRLRQPAGCKGRPSTGLKSDRPRQAGIESLGLKPLVRGIPPIRSRRRPRRRRPAKLHADKGYSYDHLRRWLCGRGIRHRIARKGVESAQRLGRHRWGSRELRPGRQDAFVGAVEPSAAATLPATVD